MIQRASDRDTWKLANWDEYIRRVNFEVPLELDDPDDPSDLIIFENSTSEQFERSLSRTVRLLQ